MKRVECENGPRPLVRRVGCNPGVKDGSAMYSALVLTIRN